MNNYIYTTYIIFKDSVGWLIVYIRTDSAGARHIIQGGFTHMAGASLCGSHNLVVPEGIPAAKQGKPLCPILFKPLLRLFIISLTKASHLANPIFKEWRSRLGILMGEEAKSYFI